MDRPGIEEALHEYMASRLWGMGCSVYVIGRTLDHVHLVHGLPRIRSLAMIIEDIKSMNS